MIFKGLLFVVDALELVVQPIGQTVLVGDDITFCCEVEGKPGPDEIQW